MKAKKGPNMSTQPLFRMCIKILSFRDLKVVVKKGRLYAPCTISRS